MSFVYNPTDNHVHSINQPIWTPGIWSMIRPTRGSYRDGQNQICQFVLPPQVNIVELDRMEEDTPVNEIKN